MTQKPSHDTGKGQGVNFQDPLYRENILDHYRHPRNFGRIENPTVTFHGDNPICGDEIDIALQLDKNKITDAKFIGRGCAISQASASMLMETLPGKTMEQASGISKDNIMEMLGVDVNATRLKCAILPLKVLEGALFLHKKENEHKLKKRNG
ncbi:MAG: nitrogen fixation protein NifU [archaeon GW2011_AR3]|nr:MAG: nitrogen fixation protein NifU [archaeon GW2011_AR3]MBS3109445.1 SUF system NifU family Fe-S cluster assembly protein [Candidatus Woesearchaeota archaeon]